MDKMRGKREISYFIRRFETAFTEMSEFTKQNSFFENFIPSWTQWGNFGVGGYTKPGL